jgi:hypothetical protein
LNPKKKAKAKGKAKVKSATTTKAKQWKSESIVSGLLWENWALIFWGLEAAGKHSRYRASDEHLQSDRARTLWSHKLFVAGVCRRMACDFDERWGKI